MSSPSSDSLALTRVGGTAHYDIMSGASGRMARFDGRVERVSKIAKPPTTAKEPKAISVWLIVSNS